MSGHSIPTDSILRRHFTQHAVSRGLPPPPEDSVLLRHYLQRLSAAAEGSSTESSGPAPVMKTPTRSTTPTPAASTTAAVEQPQGWFARLMSKLFGK